MRVSLTPLGRDRVQEVSKRRRAEIAKILQRLPRSDLTPVVEALRAFAEAAGEVPEQDWSLGWGVQQ